MRFVVVFNKLKEKLRNNILKKQKLFWSVIFKDTNPLIKESPIYVHVYVWTFPSFDLCDLFVPPLGHVPL